MLKINTLLNMHNILNNYPKKSPMKTSIQLFLFLFVLTSFTQAHSVHFSSNGLGQVLVFPYYTVNNDLNTLLSVVNTGDEVKAVKVRFLEGDNSQPVLQFNLYLAPYDVWTAALSFKDEGVELTTSDNSCVPFLDQSGQLFLSSAFVLDSGSDAIERVREGHFEIIEMGIVVDDTLALEATLINGVPHNCDGLEDAWSPGGRWFADGSDGISQATGGLTGAAVIVDVFEGTAVSYLPDVIDGFYAEGDSSHTDPVYFFPSLQNAQPLSLVIDSGKVIESEWAEGIDAISALYVRDAIINEYALGSGIEARTEWVITFPTKTFYVDPASGPIRPFNSVFRSANGACEEYVKTLYNQESESEELTGFIFRPPNGELCWSTNIIYYYNNTEGISIHDGPTILGSFNNFTGIDVRPFTAGFSSVEFPENVLMTDLSGNFTYHGLPVTGFAIQQYSNTNAQHGLLARYATIFQHRYNTLITKED